ncbi:hypothetical protein ACQUQU_06585 [Thalassolituus sp. LLYu03]|uniref:hypothetical protein n=1 Tax=Thalassolituus sp. LLYu03 TaxID=3421656 RepID=UPI003D2D0741
MTMTTLQRGALCAAIARINTPHVLLWCEENQTDPAPFSKLLTKVLSYLRAELKSLDNLHRFFDDFYEWRQQQPLNDTLNDRIADLTCAALYSATETMFDAECDDVELIQGAIDALYDEIQELGGDASGLREYWAALQQEQSELVTDKSQRPLAKAWFQWLSETDVSLFGLEE